MEPLYDRARPDHHRIPREPLRARAGARASRGRPPAPAAPRTCRAFAHLTSPHPKRAVPGRGKQRANLRPFRRPLLHPRAAAASSPVRPRTAVSPPAKWDGREGQVVRGGAGSGMLLANALTGLAAALSGLAAAAPVARRLQHGHGDWELMPASTSRPSHSASRCRRWKG